MKIDCKELISLMLKKLPDQRASLNEVMSHDWMTKGDVDSVKNHVPHREPLRLPLDQAVIQQMSFSGFKLGTPAEIEAQLEKIIQSKEYQAQHRSCAGENDPRILKQGHGKRSHSPYRGRRNSSHTSLPKLVFKAEPPKHGADAIVSIYYLVHERMERDRLKALDGKS